MRLFLSIFIGLMYDLFFMNFINGLWDVFIVILFEVRLENEKMEIIFFSFL